MSQINNRALKGLNAEIQLGVQGSWLKSHSNYVEAANDNGALTPVRVGDAVHVSDAITKQQLQTAVDNLINGAPGIADTLSEIKTYLDAADDDISANLINMANELNTDVVDLCSILGVSENATLLTTELDGGVVRASPTFIQALIDLNVNTKTIKDNIGARNATADGISLDSGKLRAVKVVHDVLSKNIGPAFADGNFTTRCVVKVTEAFSSGCGDLTISGFGSVTEEDLSEIGTTILDSGTQANNFVDGSFQGVATLDGTCVSGEAVVHIESIAV